MEDIKVIKYTSDKKNEWNAFVAASKNGTFLFDRDFMDYHSDRFEDYSLMVYNENKLIAMLPANIVDDIVHSHQGLTYGSLIFNEKTKLLSAFNAYQHILKFLYFNEISKLVIKIIPFFYNKIPSDELEYFLFISDARLTKRDVLMVIDYQHQLPFQKNRREGINKSKRAGLSIKEENCFDTFWNQILIPNLHKRHNTTPIHTLNEIKILKELFPQNIKQINVYKEDELVAGSTVFFTQTTIHPQYVSANIERNSDGSLDFLYDHIINNLNSEHIRYFSFNTSSEENGKKLNKGLLFWKETCGARTVKGDVYEVDTRVHKTLKLNYI